MIVDDQASRPGAAASGRGTRDPGTDELEQILPESMGYRPDAMQGGRRPPGSIVNLGEPLGTLAEGSIQVPSMIYFYRVPERHRAEVEATIRTFGRWVD